MRGVFTVGWSLPLPRGIKGKTCLLLLEKTLNGVQLLNVNYFGRLMD